MKTRWPALLGFPALLALGSCQDDEDENCSPFRGCDSRKPTSAWLDCDVSDHLQRIEVRAGRYFETGSPVWSGREAFSLELPLGWYAARALYVKDGDSVLAVDGEELTFSESENCGTTCYEREHVTLDLALRPEVWEP